MYAMGEMTWRNCHLMFEQRNCKHRRTIVLNSSAPFIGLFVFSKLFALL